LHDGVQVQEPGRIQLAAGHQRGSVLVELAAACMLLLAFFFASIETMFLVRDSIYLHRLVRDAAREAAITGSVTAGEQKARDLAAMYFGRNGSRVRVEFFLYAESQKRSVTCVATYPHRVFGEYSARVLGGWEVNLGAHATFGWYDFT